MVRIIYFLTLYWLVQRAYVVGLGPKNSENYGAYDIDFTSSEVLKGPKLKSIAAFNFTMVKRNGDHYGLCNLTVLEQGQIVEVKITVYSIQNTSKTLLWNYRVKEPCSHFAIGPIIVNFMDAPNCVLKKGVYIVDINYTETARKFFGASFFYGEYLMKINVMTKNANVLGFLLKELVTKRKHKN